MDKCIFTICAKNYIGLASILKKSIKTGNPEIDFKIIVADELDDDNFIINDPDIIFAKDVLEISEELWHNMSFKYNLTEFCTSIKPSSIKYLFDTLKYNRVIYLDPDILVFNSFDRIFSLLNNYSIILTPHTAEIEAVYDGDLQENSLLNSGVFNLGFIGVKNCNRTLNMLDWWEKRLIDQCYVEMLDANFTDQKWMDFLPCYFDNNELFIDRNLGCNVAPWNYYEREIVIKDTQYFVKHRKNNTEDLTPLLFVHFSGYNYSMLLEGIVDQQNIRNMSNYQDINDVLAFYKNYLTENIAIFKEFIDLKYTYNYFENGKSINQFHRRIYRRFKEKKKEIKHPFSCNSDSLYSLFEKNGMIRENSSVDKVSRFKVNNIGNKLSYINFALTFVYKIIGFKRFMLLLRLMRPYSRYESHIYLLDKKYRNNNL